MFKEVYIPGIIRHHGRGMWKHDIRCSDIDFRPWVYYTQAEWIEDWDQRGGWATLAALYLGYFTLGF
eukprot:UN26506